MDNGSEIFALKEPNPLFVGEIKNRFHLTELTSRILANREFRSLEEISAFLSPRLMDIPDPFLFREMPRVVERIHKAIINRESILIYGDYDVDGVTSTALIVNFFRHLGYPVRYHIPNRFTDGYGLNVQTLRALHAANPFSLLITVDCGTSNEEVILELKNMGVDTIVTDHHQAVKRPSGAFGVLNPALPECPFPYQELSGAGVVFFLLIALRKHFRDTGLWHKNKVTEPDLRNYLDLAGIGTVADMVPLKYINRILVTTGLDILANTKRIGLRAFLSHLGLYGKESISPWEIAFQVAPRFNAAGRLSDASLCVSLLTAESPREAADIVSELEALNAKRQGIEKKLLEQLNSEIEKGNGYLSPYAVVLWGEEWHEGVIGIAASKLVEKFGRPTVLITFSRQEGKGSVRGVSDVNIFKALRQCHHLLEAYGGHPMAGGLKINKENLHAFCETFSLSIEKQLDGTPPKKRWEIDAIIDGEEISPQFFSELPRLEPFGTGNPPPLLMFRGVKVFSKRLLKDKHIKISFGTRAGSAPVSGVAFNAEKEWETIDQVTGLVGVPTLNVWNGTTTPQINIKRFLYS